MQHTFRRRRRVVLALGRLLLKRPWLIFVIGGTVVLLIELAEHWYQPVMFDAHFWVEVVVYGVGGPFILWLLLRWLARILSLDLPTKRVQSEASLAERQRIARDLHDKLAQNLGYLHFKLDQLHTSGDASLADFESIQDELAHMRHVADQAYEQVRATLNDLRRDTSIPTNLLAELQQHAIDAARRDNQALSVKCSVNCDLICQIVKRTVLNISQEAVNNVVKHARASQVTIDLSCQQKDTILTIADDGIGIDVGKKNGNGHYGLEIMRERAEEIGGQLTITSAPGEGTKLVALFPNTVISEPLLQICTRLQCNHLNSCYKMWAQRVETSPPAIVPPPPIAPDFGRPYENSAG